LSHLPRATEEKHCKRVLTGLDIIKMICERLGGGVTKALEDVDKDVCTAAAKALRKIDSDGAERAAIRTTQTGKW
jgi:hypothetical protein